MARRFTFRALFTSRSSRWDVRRPPHRLGPEGEGQPVESPKGPLPLEGGAAVAIDLSE